MNHFFEKIDGFSSFYEQGNLLYVVLNNLKPSNEKKINIAEIGVYKGKLTALWNVELLNLKLNYDYYAIDTFEGSSEHVKNYDYYKETCNNLESIKNYIKIIKNESTIEAKNYPDEFFDFVYVDASHDYDSVTRDLETWYPKVKNNGIIAGDDYCQGWKDVILAVNDFFKSEKLNLVSNQQWWVKKINP
jgi:hypothetical protein